MIFSIVKDIFYVRISIMLCAERIMFKFYYSLRSAHIPSSCKLNSTDCIHAFIAFIHFVFALCRFATNAMPQNENQAREETASQRYRTFQTQIV